MAKLRPLAIALCLSLLQGALAPSGHAQVDEDLARQLFETGRAYFDRAEFDKAAEAFGEAYARSGRPALLVNQARALEALGRYDEAVALLEKASAELPADSDIRPSLETRLRRLRAQAERAHAEGEAPAGEAAPEPAPALTPSPAEPTDAESGEGRGALFWSGAGAVGLGGASLVVALATGLRSHAIAGDLEAACPGDVCAPEYASDIEKSDRLAVASTVTLAVGVAASATGVLLMLLTRDREDDRVELTGGPGQAGAGLRVRF